ncbi:MAG: dihydrofolate reductase [Bacteroidota bacterium]
MRKIALIAAMSENRVLGKDNKLVWELPADWENFRRVTAGQAFVMGRVSYESEDMLFSDRLNVILSRRPQLELPEGFVRAPDLPAALDLLADEETVFILGGGQVFAQSLPLASYLYLTIVHHEFEGDAFFPPVDWSQWEMVRSVFHPVDDHHAYPFSLQEFRRILPAPKG